MARSSVLCSVLNRVQEIDPFRRSGRVTEMVGLLVKAKNLKCALGDLCEVETSTGRRLPVQVIGFREDELITMPLDETDGLLPGDRIVARTAVSAIGAGDGLLGRVVDAFGNPIDGKGPIPTTRRYPLAGDPGSLMTRKIIDERFITGVKVFDALLPLGKGQRVGIFGGSGVGKSVLLGSLAKNSAAQVNVVGLIGERNREVREFLEHDLGPEGLARSVVVVATSDRPAPLRVRAAFTVASIAEYFRDQGKDVLMIVDSITRLAMAQREIGLAAGEPPSQKGYTPSVFAMLPKVCERAGNFEQGSITGLYTVLVEGDDFNEPIADSVRSILDGHVILSRKLGAVGHYPAVDVLNSVSRLASKISDADAKQASQQVRQALALYKNSEDLIQLGAYVSGTNTKLDDSIRLMPSIDRFLCQDADRNVPIEETMGHLQKLSDALQRKSTDERLAAGH